MGTKVATFPGCAVIIHWLPHTPVQIFFRLFLVHKIVWCSLSSSSIQTGVLVVTFRITLLDTHFPTSGKESDMSTFIMKKRPK